MSPVLLLVGGFNPFEQYVRPFSSFPQGSGWTFNHLFFETNQPASVTLQRASRPLQESTNQSESPSSHDLFVGPPSWDDEIFTHLPWGNNDDIRTMGWRSYSIWKHKYFIVFLWRDMNCIVFPPSLAIGVQLVKACHHNEHVIVLVSNIFNKQMTKTFEHILTYCCYPLWRLPN